MTHFFFFFKKKHIRQIHLTLPWLILTMNTLKMVFVWLVTVAFLYMKKLSAQTKQKTITTKWYNYIYAWGFSNELETYYIFYIIVPSWSFICKNKHKLLEIFLKNKCFWILKIQSQVTYNYKSLKITCEEFSFTEVAGL